YLLNQVSPRHVLEDFVRALETRQAPLAELLAAAHGMRATLEELKANAEQVLQQFAPPANDSPAAGSLNALFAQFVNETKRTAPVASAPETPHFCCDLLAPLVRWQETSGAAEDCPLPELFRQAQAATPGLTIGTFHDELRHLLDKGKIYLHP